MTSAEIDTFLARLGAVRRDLYMGQGAEVLEDLDGIVKDLLQKNAAYGDSALRPVRIFSRADPEEQIRTRLDDKLSRLARGDGSGDEDAEADLLGYLVLLRIAKLRRERAVSTPITEGKKAP